MIGSRLWAARKHEDGTWPLDPSYPDLDTAMEALKQASCQIDVPVGRTLMLEGEVGRESVLIAEGFAEVTIGGERIAQLGPGDLVGEMALAEDRLRSATVTATTPMRVFVMDPSQFDRIFAEPNLAKWLTTIRSERVRR